MTLICLVGDIHGCLEQLDEVVTEARTRADQLVFLGDYVNRGSRSREVVDYLIALNAANDISVTLLAGNHDIAFLEALQGGNLDTFLLMGGASTVKSYVRSPYADVLSQLRSAVPVEHVQFLRGLKNRYVGNGVAASHEPQADQKSTDAREFFEVCGHLPQGGTVPLISNGGAFIDTGCGTLPGGKLTGFFWPTCEWIQSRPWR